MLAVAIAYSVDCGYCEPVNGDVLSEPWAQAYEYDFDGRRWLA